MNKIHILGGVACVSVLLATGAFAEILGVQPGTSDNPKDNVPKEIQRGTPGGGTFGEGGTGPGTRSKALTGMDQADIGTRQEIQELEQINKQPHVKQFPVNPPGSTRGANRPSNQQ